jgi:hypothetical protein
MKLPRHFTFVLLILPALSAGGQDLRLKTEVYFQDVRNGKYPAAPGEFSEARYEDTVRVLIIPFMKDSVSRVRIEALRQTYGIAERSPDAALRQQGVLNILVLCDDDDMGIRSTALDLLKGFGKGDFTGAAIDRIKEFVRTETTPADAFFKVAGFLELSDLIPIIRPWSQPGNATSIRWASILALSRMGDTSATVDMMRRIRSRPVNDDMVYELLPDILYTRQREPVHYAVDQLYSDEKNCMSADAETEVPVLCGYRIMELLAPVIAAYPLQLSAYGDLDVDDYEKALKNVREWFSENQAYTILKDNY